MAAVDAGWLRLVAIRLLTLLQGVGGHPPAWAKESTVIGNQPENAGTPDQAGAEPLAASGAYRKPILTMYGSIRALTQSGAATTNGDGGQLMMP